MCDSYEVYTHVHSYCFNVSSIQKVLYCLYMYDCYIQITLLLHLNNIHYKQTDNALI